MFTKVNKALKEKKNVGIVLSFSIKMILILIS